MLSVGLTGNIGAGKSTVARWLREWGATLIDADELVREVQLPGSDTLRAIAREFGDDILQPDGSLDREVLRTRAMRDAQALNALNEIVHPAVQQRRAERALLAEERGDCLLVNDIPLLFEVLDPTSFDVVILVDAPEALRRERIMRERGLSQEIAERMIAAQMPAPERWRSSRLPHAPRGARSASAPPQG
jgi:dephospho-CoA kinase